MIQMTEIEIVEETVKYYRTHGRGTSRHGCVYLADNGCMCALGRAMTPDGLDRHGSSSEDAGGLFTEMWRDIEGNSHDEYPDVNEEVYDQSFKEKYRGHDRSFWGLLQEFHDGNNFWLAYKTKKGSRLTAQGKAFLKDQFPQARV
jgi:hypothetical protein